MECEDVVSLCSKVKQSEGTLPHNLQKFWFCKPTFTKLDAPLPTFYAFDATQLSSLARSIATRCFEVCVPRFQICMACTTAPLKRFDCSTTYLPLHTAPLMCLPCPVQRNVITERPSRKKQCECREFKPFFLPVASLGLICVSVALMCKYVCVFVFGFCPWFVGASKEFQPPTSHFCVQLLNSCPVAVVSVVTDGAHTCWLICCNAGVLFVQIYNFFVLLRRFGIATVLFHVLVHGPSWGREWDYK